MKRLWLSMVLSLVGGMVMSLATAPLNWWVLAWVALVPLWVAVRSIQESGNVRAVCLCAVSWGLAYHGLTLAWILGLHPLTWLGVPWLASVAIAVFCWIFITCWGTAANLVWAGVIAWLGTGKQQIGSKLAIVLVGTALWCGLEVVLNLTPLSWTSLSFTQSPGNLVLLHVGRLSGPAMVTAAIVAVNGLLAESWLLLHARWQRSGEVKFLLAIAGLILIGAHAIGFYFYRQPLAESPDTALTIGLIQGNIPTREKLSEVGIQRAIQAYVSGYDRLADAGVDAVLTPEGALPFLWDQSRNPFYAAVLNRNVDAWLGSFVADNDHITQSLLSLAGDGTIVGRYNKIKLVPLGEYIPFQETIGNLIGRLSPIKSSMTPGAIDQQFDTPFGRAIASICYESVFPDLFRRQATAGGQFILTASNLDPYNEVLMAQHQAHDLMRTIELDRWAARATNTGYSGFIDPHGNILWRSQPQTYQLHTTTIHRRQTQTLYVRWGDWFTPTLLASAALVFWVKR